MKTEELVQRDLLHIWHPCSQMSEYKEYPPILITRAKGVWLYTKDNRKILDAISSWWVNLFGHTNKKISKAIKKQLNRLEHVIFANYTHEPAIRLASELIKLFPGLTRVFFSDNGSTSIEVALKMSWQFCQQTGKDRNIFAYLGGAYHGETLGALSVGGLGIYKTIFQRLLFQAVEIPGPDCFRCPYNQNRNNCSTQCFEKTAETLEKIKDKTIAIIAEPILQAAAGMRIYPPLFLKKLREFTKENQIFLICDEIAAGFGRTGKLMASYHADIIPDFVCLSKGLTGGFLPLGVTITSEDIYNSFLGEREKAFLHSHSYTGNPLACIAGCEVMKIFKDPKTIEMINRKSKILEEKLKIFNTLKHTGEVRQIGLVAAIELVKEKERKTPFDPVLRTGYKVYRTAEKKGVLLRNLGDVIYFMPPYTITEKEMDFMIKIAYNSIKEITENN